MNIEWGWGSTIAALTAGAAALLPLVGELANDPRLAGVDPFIWIILAAVIGGALVIGRMIQAGRGVQRPVSWGPASIIGYLGALALVATPFIGELASTVDPLGVPSAVWTLASGALLVLTTLGRMDQASRLEPSILAAEYSAGPGEEA